MISSIYNSKEKLWRGNDIPSLYNPQISLAQALLSSMSLFGPKIAQINDDSGICMSFDEIKLKTIRAAQNLQALGYKPKRVFTLIAKNSHHVAPITFATIAAGCAINALDPSFGKTELVHMMRITEPALVFCDLECFERVRECLLELKNPAKIFTFNGSVEQSEAVETLFKQTNEEDKFIPVKVDGANDAGMIICSSGTTGLPKGVCMSHTCLLDVASRFDPTNSTEVMLCFSSLYWGTGVSTLLRGTICGAQRIITTDPFSPELQLRLIEKYKATYILNAPHHLVLMMKNEHFKDTDISSLRFSIVVGSKLPHHSKVELSKYLPNGNVIEVYGLSEAGGGITYDYPPAKGKETNGRLISGFCVKVVDESGKRCGVNEEGELCIKMPWKFIGYYNNVEASRELHDEEGFVVTGDIGRFDEDGDLHITGRKKELLKYCNMQVSPAQIDAFLTESPDIKSACVVGIPDSMNDLPAAVVVRAKGSNITEEEVSNLVEGHFADHYKLRGGVYFVDSLPTTPSGKVLRRNVKDMAIKVYNMRRAT